VVDVAGVVAQFTLRLTKSAEKMAILRLEDLRGSIEVVVYPRTYAQVQDQLRLDEPVLIHGRIQVRDEEINVSAERITSLSRYREEHARRLTVRLAAPPPEAVLPRVAGVLAKQEGACAVRFEVPTARGHRVLVDSGIATVPSDGLMEELAELLPQAQLRFDYEAERLPHGPAPRSGPPASSYAAPRYAAPRYGEPRDAEPAEQLDGAAG
jgi:DNA polymerase-3 subunit alpha